LKPAATSRQTGYRQAATLTGNERTVEAQKIARQ